MFRAIVVISIALVASLPAEGQQHQKPPTTKKTNTENQSSDAPIVVVNAPPSNQDENKSGSKPSKRPPLWDIYWPSIGLVILGAIGTVLAILTLRDLRREVKAAETAANAAASTAQALIEGLRPVVAAQPKRNAISDLFDPTAHRVRIELTNTGLTTAYDCVYETWIELLPPPSPESDFTNDAEYYKATSSSALYPHHEAVVINIPIQRGLSPKQLEQIKRLELYVCVRMRVAFRDAFTPNRIANFGFYVTFLGFGFLQNYNNEKGTQEETRK